MVGGGACLGGLGVRVWGQDLTTKLGNFSGGKPKKFIYDFSKSSNGQIRICDILAQAFKLDIFLQIFGVFRVILTS